MQAFDIVLTKLRFLFVTIWELEASRCDNYPSVTLTRIFLFLLGFGRPKIQLKNDPEPRGVISPKYEPIPIHGDPIHPQNFDFLPTLSTHHFRRRAIFVMGRSPHLLSFEIWGPL